MAPVPPGHGTQGRRVVEPAPPDGPHPARPLRALLFHCRNPRRGRAGKLCCREQLHGRARALPSVARATGAEHRLGAVGRGGDVGGNGPEGPGSRASHGLRALPPNEALRLLERAMLELRPQIGILSVDWGALLTGAVPRVRRSSIFKDLVAAAPAATAPNPRPRRTPSWSGSRARTGAAVFPGARLRGGAGDPAPRRAVARARSQ